MCEATMTLILSLATVALAFGTFWLVWETRQGSKRQLQVQTWLNLEPRFDSKDMKEARKRLAVQLESYDPLKHDEITEEVLELFESIGTVYNLGLLNKKLTESSFGYHASRWWEIAKSYIDRERKANGDDNEIFGEFEKFAKAMRQSNETIDSNALTKFLNDEKNLHTD